VAGIENSENLKAVLPFLREGTRVVLRENHGSFWNFKESHHKLLAILS